VAGLRDWHQPMSSSQEEENDRKFRQGIEQFNAHKFFEAHETWEEIWLHAKEPEKTFLQGIIQISAAFHHYGRGNHSGLRSLLNAGLKKIAGFPASYKNIELEALRDAARHWAAALASGRDPGVGELPRIKRKRRRRRASS